MAGWETALAIAGLGVITVVSRGFFVLPEREVPLPEWLRQGLRYAPLAALAAVVVPEVLLTQGAWLGTWKDPRVFAALAGGGYYFWRRGILGTIVTGMAALLILRIGFGW